MRTDVGWRVVDEDGARLYFHPQTGLRARWSGDDTRHLRRTAPAVVMFGITNVCNLNCSFCSRGKNDHSNWTLYTATTLLTELATAGVLEVAFGGGEPFAFGGFAELLARLSSTTALALHVTTNGTLITEAIAAAIAPHVGQVRVSVYDDNPWDTAMTTLAEAGVQAGANVIVDPARLSALPTLLQRLRDVGCHDVALLSYVGHDATMHLHQHEDRWLSRIIAEAPLPVRVSVCFGHRLDVPLLFGDVDCGAGSAFLSIGADGSTRACSFHSAVGKITTAAEALQLWREARALLVAPSSRLGCARVQSKVAHIDHQPRLELWSGFSGNNSGECVHVARFQTVDAAEAAMTTLATDHRAGESYAPAFRALLMELKIPVRHVVQEAHPGLQTDRQIIYTSGHPDALVRVGRVVMAATEWALDDVFPEIRALLWRQGGTGTYVGVHEHGHVLLAFAFAASNPAAVDAIDTAVHLPHRACATRRRALSVVGLLQRSESLPEDIAFLEQLAAAHDAHVAVELVPLDGPLDDHVLGKTMAVRTTKANQQHMWIRFDSEDNAVHFAKDVEGAVQADRYALLSGERVGPRLGYLAARYGGSAAWLVGELTFTATLYRKHTGKAQRKMAATHEAEMQGHAASLSAQLRALQPRAAIEVTMGGQSCTLSMAASQPGALLQAAAAYATGLDELMFYAHFDASGHIQRAIDRVHHDVVLLRRR